MAIVANKAENKANNLPSRSAERECVRFAREASEAIAGLSWKPTLTFEQECRRCHYIGTGNFWLN
ncbi:hypothetical protein [Brasilonema bromeliae]|uniref:hypothetical protein n=1 Tax=Brasilonema bromeliae TaxID=383615 RepID=UPI00145FB25F|nr:hypothetical protein [Brasilonema bromeliae]